VRARRVSVLSQLGTAVGSFPRSTWPRALAEQEAFARLKSAVVLHGGNYVLVQGITWNRMGTSGWQGRAFGIAYSCPLAESESPRSTR
jgi:hypothetical protein